MKNRIFIAVIALFATVSQVAVMLGAAYGFAQTVEPLHAIVVQDKQPDANV